ncbi:low molecular weight phosphotyrosine protein phosphatase [Mycoplasmatota bacterium]|nr:low molecular weight phosphotyrosine protein phosphatase [Mycoplasmatota bacterium]
MIRVLFVCLGNICRSPMAEGLFKKRIEELGLKDYIHIESRATSSWEEGNLVHHGTEEILINNNIDVSHMISTQIREKDFIEFDYLIGMDEQNVDHLLRMQPSLGHKVHLYLDIDKNQVSKSAADPYYTHDFNQTYEDIMSVIDTWIEKFKLDLNID